MTEALKKAQTEALQNAIRELALIRQVSEDEILAEARSAPHFLERVERRAKERGITVREVLEQDIQRRHAVRYPGPDCLEPLEVERWANGGLPEARLSHVDTCLGCEELISRARLGETAAAEMADRAVQEAIAAAAVCATKPALRRAKATRGAVRRWAAGAGRVIAPFGPFAAIAAMLVAFLAGRYSQRQPQGRIAVTFSPSVAWQHDTTLTRLSGEATRSVEAGLYRSISQKAGHTPEGVTTPVFLELPREKGSTSLDTLRGKLSWDGASIRLDAELSRKGRAFPLARTSVTAAPDEFYSTVDSVAGTLLRQARDSLTRHR